MSYSAGEALILTALQAITGSVWTVNNSGRGTWHMLNQGKADHYAIVKPGAFSSQFIAAAAIETDWQTTIEVWQAYVDDGSSLTNLEALTAAIITKFSQKKILDDTTGSIVDSYCSGGGEVQEMFTKGGGPAWLRQDIYINWKEIENVTFS